jgi:hypothetical protein
MTNVHGADRSWALLAAILTICAIPIVTTIAAHQRWGAEPSIALLIAILTGRQLAHEWATARKGDDNPEER